MKRLHVLIGASAIALTLGGSAYAADYLYIASPVDSVGIPISNPTYDPNLTSLGDPGTVTYTTTTTTIVADTSPYDSTRAERREERREAREERREERREARRDMSMSGGLSNGLGSEQALGSPSEQGGINASGSGNGKP